MSEKPIGVGVVGVGVVGHGAARILHENEKHFKDLHGVSLRLKTVCDADPGKLKELSDLEGVRLAADFQAVLDDPEIGVIVETIGGDGAAKVLTEKALADGKSVVTANKALLAHHGPALFSSAMDKGAFIGFEASVGGGIPVIRTVMESFVPETVIRLRAIINGTSNYILSEMFEHGGDFNDVLKAAQALGYAEADPTFDIEGQDALHKLTLLTWLAFRQWIPYGSMEHSGISGISPVDIELARELGYRFKLLAVAQRIDPNGLAAYVAPHLVPVGTELAAVDGVLNAVQLESDNLGPTLLSGKGAGRWPTASAVVSDVVDIARSLLQGMRPHYPDPTPTLGGEGKMRFVPLSETQHKYYLRMTVADRTGVLADVLRVLARKKIGISTVVQPDLRSEEGLATVILLTYSALESELVAAVAEIDALEDSRVKTVFYRIEEPQAGA